MHARFPDGFSELTGFYKGRTNSNRHYYCFGQRTFSDPASATPSGPAASPRPRRRR